MWVTHFDDNGVYQKEIARALYETHSHDMDDGHSHGDTETNIMLYKDWDGKEVIGASQKFEIAGTNMLVLSEMDYTMAITPVINFRDKLIFIISITAMVVFFIAGLITRSIVAPIQLMTNMNYMASSRGMSKVKYCTNVMRSLNCPRGFRIMTRKLRRLVKTTSPAAGIKMASLD